MEPTTAHSGEAGMQAEQSAAHEREREREHEHEHEHEHGHGHGHEQIEQEKPADLSAAGCVRT